MLTTVNLSWQSNALPGWPIIFNLLSKSFTELSVITV